MGNDVADEGEAAAGDAVSSCFDARPFGKLPWKVAAAPSPPFRMPAFEDSK
jgi:hypothetical protein